MQHNRRQQLLIIFGQFSSLMPQLGLNADGSKRATEQSRYIMTT